MRCMGEVERLDARLASQAETGLRLRLGQVLEVLGRGKHFELGFSSVAAYVLERCDRSVRWVEAARCLARRLEALPAQYARERLGMSHSSMAARRALALRLEQLPMVANALGAGQIGVEAALQVVRVATPTTQAAWVTRAQQRTIKHLREEVAAALVAVRVSGEADCPPPADAEMAAFNELEQAVVSGSVCQPRPANDSQVERDVRGVLLTEPASDERRAWLVMLGSLGEWLEGGLQVSAAGGRAAASGAASRVGSSAGRITLRLRVTRSTYVWWRGLEAQARRWLPCGMRFMTFLCLSMWQAWRHLLGGNGGKDVAYGQI